ncbi:LPXTG cell wall anchor domain-containing protein [Yinghuangia soli]|uniref:LPXTG cell wall anchor domain-containing protein n=1 Tax=Yinghuangia soli TaxID=2908204 RepID=A0AA41Q0S4_9ACTN|nr:LPXTG cell wall anchor domain-containing protein [Yinghuangia soli]MCF2529450.1 LPXTG cell wall anchor domain-containing protein [Yinghuangia soli]
MRRSLAVTATASLLATAPALAVLAAPGTAYAEGSAAVQTTAPGVLGIAGSPTPFSVKVSNGNEQDVLGFELSGADLNPALGGLQDATIDLEWQDGNGKWHPVTLKDTGKDKVSGSLPARDFAGETVVQMRVRVAPKAPAGPDDELATFNAHDPSAPKPPDPANPYGHIKLATSLRNAPEADLKSATQDPPKAADTDTVKLGAPTVALVDYPATHVPGGPAKQYKLRIDNPTDSAYPSLSAMLAFDLKTTGNDSKLLKLEASKDGKDWKPVPAMDVPGEMINPLPDPYAIQPRSSVDQLLRMSFTDDAKPGDGVTYLAVDVMEGDEGEPAPIAEFCGERGLFKIVTAEPAPTGAPTPGTPGTPAPDGPTLADTGGDSNTTTLMGIGAALLAAAGGGTAYAMRRRRA